MRAPTYNLADLWETLCDAGPDAECLVAPPVRHTRGSLDREANRIANHLVATGVRPGDRVGIYARNRAEYVEALLGCWKCGAVPVNINWRYVADELRYVIDDAEIVTMIVEDEYLPVLDELGFDRRIRVGEWSETRADRVFADVPRSSDDVYMLYTGGTTGMPKGVMWRHEDFFYACCMGGSPFDPITEPAEIARNAEPAFRMSPLVLGPLMHGGGQWLTLIAVYGGNRAVVYTDRHFDPAAVLDLAVAEHATTIGIIGDAMARPLAEAALAQPDRWDCSEIIGLGNGGAMLSASVKTQLAAAFPNAVLNDSYGASETGAAGSEVGASTERDRPRFSTDGRTWVLDPETLEPLEPGSGVEGLFARKGHIPLGYWNDPVKTAATFRTDARRRAVGRSRRLGDDRRRGPDRVVRPRVGLHQLRGREDLPRGGRGRGAGAPGRLRRGGRRCARRSLRAEGRGAGEDARRGARAHARVAAGTLPHQDRGVQGAA